MKKGLSNTGVPTPRNLIADLLFTLGELAVDQARLAAARRGEVRRVRKGSTLRPGDDTPLWNSLVDSMKPHLAKRGVKANLARVLEVPRQRVSDYFVTRTQMPDAERMLHVLLWLASRQEPGTLGKIPKPVR
ncbi:MAG: hypothetical protein WC661_00210 [Opitutaceae bacterium]|jgi:hypothetical protein